MNDKLDELAKAMAQSVTRRAALRRFGFGLAGAALAALGLKDAEAVPKPPKYLCCRYYDSNSTVHNFKLCVPLGQGCPDLSANGFHYLSSSRISSCSQCK